MTFNELMVRQNFISKVLLKNGDKELSKELKVKIMSIRIELSKKKKELESDLQEIVKQLTPEGYQELAVKENRTKEEDEKLIAWNKDINDGYNEYLNQRGRDEVDVKATLTDDEYNQIIEVNADNDVEINGQKINAGDFLEILYSLFVE